MGIQSLTRIPLLSFHNRRGEDTTAKFIIVGPRQGGDMLASMIIAGSYHGSCHKTAAGITASSSKPCDKSDSKPIGFLRLERWIEPELMTPVSDCTQPNLPLLNSRFMMLRERSTIGPPEEIYQDGSRLDQNAIRSKAPSSKR